MLIIKKNDMKCSNLQKKSKNWHLKTEKAVLNV